MTENSDRKQPRRRSLGGRIKDEEDPAWRSWFQQVEDKRKQLAKLSLKISRYEKDGKETIVAREESHPQLLKKFMSKVAKIDGPRHNADLLYIHSLWKESVIPDIARESEVFSFKGGTLTIAVFNSPLLQEIRQFHKSSILKDLREYWSAGVPLVDIKFIIGKR